MQQVNRYFVLDVGVGKDTSWQDVEIENGNAAVLSGTAVNKSYGGSHVVQVDLQFTYPGSSQFTEILDSIVVKTFSTTMPPYGSPTHVDTIDPGDQALNQDNQLDFRVTLDYPYGAPTGQYIVNVIVNGNYE